jgi:hypothetical protein
MSPRGREARERIDAGHAYAAKLLSGFAGIGILRKVADSTAYKAIRYEWFDTTTAQPAPAAHEAATTVAP